jgi:ubiquinone/menaquinone biosynthesis C-methylase UbiE
MAKMAEARGMSVIRAYAEDLPIEKNSYDFVLFVTTICFLSDIPKALAEAHRILRDGGEIIVAFIDKTSTLGKKYEREKSGNKFYANAHFHSTPELTGHLKTAGFTDFTYWQTLIRPELNHVEQPAEGYGKGSFVVIRAVKTLSMLT